MEDKDGEKNSFDEDEYFIQKFLEVYRSEEFEVDVIENVLLKTDIDISNLINNLLNIFIGFVAFTIISIFSHFDYRVSFIITLLLLVTAIIQLKKLYLIKQKKKFLLELLANARIRGR